MLSTGVSKRSELAALGPTPNLAARLQGEAEPHAVLVSETTRALTGGRFEFDTLSPRTLKGIPDAVRPHQVRAERRGRSRFAARSRMRLSPFVGRDEELDLLARRWARTKEGRGQAVLAVGEPGIGKSRLLQQLRQRIGIEPHRLIALQCSPYHANSALRPTIAAFEQALGFAQIADEGRRLQALQDHLEDVGEFSEETLGLLTDLLSLAVKRRFPGVEAMDPARRRAGTRWHRSTAGSTRDSLALTCVRRRRCWRVWAS